MLSYAHEFWYHLPTTVHLERPAAMGYNRNILIIHVCRKGRSLSLRIIYFTTILGLYKPFFKLNRSCI